VIVIFFRPEGPKPKHRTHLPLRSMLSLYQTLYKNYSSYGPKRCVFLQVGSFYELYDSIDSQGDTLTPIRKAAEIMNIALSEETKGQETFLKAGVPDYKLHKFSQVLTQQGWTVIVVDQVRDSAGNIIDRVPSRILSPGTHHETATRDRMSVAGIYVTDRVYGISVIDIPTGDVFSLQTSSASEILHMTQVYNVKEIIIKQDVLRHDEASVRSLFSLHCTLHVSKDVVQRELYSELYREEFLQSTFRPSLLPIIQALGLPFPRLSVLETGLCCLLQFIKDHFPSQQIQILRHTLHKSDEYLRVNNNVLEQVNYITHKEGQNSVLDLLEKSRSAIGARALRERMLRPITSSSTLEKRWADVEWGTRIRTDPNHASSKHTLDRDLKGIYDLPRLHTRISAGTLSAGDVLQLFQSYTHIECLMKELEGTPIECPSSLASRVRSFRSAFDSSFDEEKATRRENGELVGFLSSSVGFVTANLEQQLHQTLGSWEKTWTSFCTSIQISPGGCQLQRKSDGEFQFECPRSIAKALLAEKDKLKLECNLRKSGPLLITCPTLEACVTKVYELHRRLETSLKTELQPVCDRLWEQLIPIQQEWIEWIGNVDCTLTLASVAVDNVWIKPRLSESLNIKGMRHPLIESRNTRIAYVKHDVALGKEANGWLLYGVNASGKSSLMKAVGICVLLAQAGSFVPADVMELRPYTSLHSRIWSHDNLWAGLSSFAVEVGELRDILESADNRSLVLGDEVCSGTESISATSLVATTLEHLDDKKSHFLFATHLHDLLKVPGLLDRRGISVFHLRVIRTLEGKLIYDRTLLPGSGSSTYGLEVAKAMGLPFSFMERAYSIRATISGEQSIQSSWNSSIFRKSCEICGSTLASELEVHHIEHRENGGSNSPRNLAVVCNMCHHKHHDEGMEIPPLQQTSEGAERIPSVSAPSTSVTKQKRPDDEIKLITSTVEQYRGRPPERIAAALHEQGISIRAAELKRFIRG
jgi:DNA mismatch repair protein MutS